MSKFENGTFGLNFRWTIRLTLSICFSAKLALFEDGLSVSDGQSVSSVKTVISIFVLFYVNLVQLKS